MELDGPESDTFYDITNRGRLFTINDEAYYLFVAIELAMHDKLTDALERSIVSSESHETKTAITDFVTSDIDVYFHWSVDVQDISHSNELLRHNC